MTKFGLEYIPIFINHNELIKYILLKQYIASNTIDQFIFLGLKMFQSLSIFVSTLETCN